MMCLYMYMNVYITQHTTAMHTIRGSLHEKKKKKKQTTGRMRADVVQLSMFSDVDLPHNRGDCKFSGAVM